MNSEGICIIESISFGDNAWMPTRGQMLNVHSLTDSTVTYFS